MKDLMNSLGLNIPPGAQQLMGQIERQQQQVKADFQSGSIGIESPAKIYIKYVKCHCPLFLNESISRNFPCVPLAIKTIMIVLFKILTLFHFKAVRSSWLTLNEFLIVSIAKGTQCLCKLQRSEREHFLMW